MDVRMSRDSLFVKNAVKIASRADQPDPGIDPISWTPYAL
jgi:hypothetical protein